MNKVKGYRTMIGYSQEDMAKALDISTTAYRYKEAGDRPFTQDEMIKFTNTIKAIQSDIKMDDIFF